MSREVKRTSKKALSLLLAVLMVMTSMSVCFGTFSFTAAAEETDYISELADKLKDSAYSETLGLLGKSSKGGSGLSQKTEVTFTNYRNYKQAAELLRLVDNAMKQTDDWKTAETFSGVGGSAGTDNESACGGRNTNDLYNSLVKGLEKKSVTIDNNIKAFLGSIYHTTGATLHTSASKNSSKSTWTNTVTYTTSDYKGYLAQIGKASAVESAAEMSVKYSISMKGDLYYQNGCDEYYHHQLWPSSFPVNAPATNSTNTDMKSQVNAHISKLNTYINMKYADMLEMSASALDATVTELNTAISNHVTYVGAQSTYDSLYADYAAGIANFRSSVESAKAFADFMPTVDAWNAFVAANPDYGVFHYPYFGDKGSEGHTKLLADFATFKAYRDYLLTGGSIYEYLLDYNYIDETYYTNFYDNVVAYDLQDSKDAADALYAQYSAVNPDMEETEMSLEEKTIAFNSFAGFINNIGNYSNQVKNAVYTQGWQYLIDMREFFKCEINTAVLYFAENAYKTFTDMSTTAIWNEINVAKGHQADLEALYNEVKANAGQDKADQLLATLRADAATMIENLYKTLADRFTLEVNNAYELYVKMGKPTSLKVDTFLQLSAVIVSIEGSILTDLQAAGKAGYITQTTIDRYNELNKEGGIIAIWNAYASTFGFPDYKQTQIQYADRTPMEGDELKTANDPVTEAEMLKLIAALDKIITSDTVGGLLGGLLGAEEGEAFNLGTMLTDLIKGALFTDDFINTVVQMLYPLVLKEFDKVWAGLPQTVPYSGMNVKVQYAKTLHTILQEGEFEIYPDLLASRLEKRGQQTKYAENIAILKSAGGEADAWTSSKLVDVETGKLKLSWGVAEQKEKLDAGEITQAQFDKFFYDAFEDATSGLLPLLTSLITNKAWAPAQCKNIGRANPGILGIMLDISLQLGSEAHNGYADFLVPIYEILGVPYTAVSSINGNTDVSYVLEQILAPIFTFLNNLGKAPVDTLLGILPDLVYALAFRMAKPALNMLRTRITYDASASMVGSVLADGADVKVGDMLITDDAGALLPNSMFAGGLNTILAHFGLNIPAIDQATLATLGQLTTMSTNRQTWIYDNSALGAGKAYSIKADKADVGYYLLSYVLGIVKDPASLSQLLGLFMTKKDADGNPVLDVDGKKVADTEAIAKLQETMYNDEGLNLDEINVGNAIAAIVELANQPEYIVDAYNWYAGEYSSPVGKSVAMDIYLNPGNDWTKDKAEYLYNNLETLLGSIFTMANLDLDKETEGVQTSVEDALGGLIGGLFSNETVTSLAKLLGSLSDLEALLAPKAEEEGTEGEDAPEASEPEVVAEEGEEATEEAAGGINLAEILNDLLKNELGIDLSVYAQYANIAEGEVVDFGVTDAETFVAALTELLKPLKSVVDFILGGKDLTLIDSAITLQGYNGYNNAIIPLLEALGATPAAYTADADTLALTLNALVGVINKITTNDPAVANDGAIYTIIDMLPGIIYYISSNALSQGIDKLLTPVYALLDTIRPIYNLDLNELLAGIEVDFDKDGVKEPLGLDIHNINWEFIFGLLNDLLGLDLSDLQQVIYDVAKSIGVEYTSASTLGTFKKGAYNADFTQADLLTVVLSFILEWATVADNAAKLDEMLGTNGIIAGLNTVFAEAEIEYGTPTWYYWFDTEEAFDAYIESGAGLPNTLASIDWENIGDNDWDLETAQYFAENIDELVDIIIAMITKNEDATVATLINDLIAGYISADTLNNLVGMIAGLLGDIDDNLLEAAGYILGDSTTNKKEFDLVGLKAYKCTAEIDSISDFINELAVVLDTYAGGLVNFLFFGDDFRFAKNSDNKDTIVINGGLGYEKGLAIILEALGCDVPAADKATTITVLGALATRVDAILADPVNEVLDLLPNLIYVLNANGLGVAVTNLLQPVYALLDKLAVFGLEVNLADLLKFNVNGKEIAIDLANLSLENVVEVVETATDLPLDAAEEILVNFCTGKITKAEFGYKMEAAREDVITILLVVVLELVSDKDFAAKLDEMLGTDGIVAGIKGIFEPSNIKYSDVDWQYVDGVTGKPDVYLNKIYGTDWDRATAEYLAENLPVLVNTVIKMIEIDGVKYESLADLLKANVNVFTTKTLNSLLDLIKNLLGDIDAELLEVGCVLDVDLAGLMKHEVPADIKTVDAFAAELANILSKYAKGVVEWLLLGRDFKLLVKDNDGIGAELEGTPYITISGANGYSEGLALLLEALGVAAPAVAYDVNDKLDTEATLKAVFAAIADRINEIFANPVEEVLALLPNVIYFLNSNGVATVIDNTIAAVTALLAKLEGLGVKLNINELVNLPKLMGIEGKDASISLDNLTVEAIIEAVGLMLELDLSRLDEVLNPFAIGSVEEYDSISSQKYAYKMVVETKEDKADMITVILGAALRVVFENEKNTAKLEEMIGTDILSKIKAVFESKEINYATVDWQKLDANQKPVDYVNEIYGTDWDRATAEYLAENLPLLVNTVIGLIDENYDSLGEFLGDKVNVFTTKTLNSLVGLLKGLVPDMYKGLLGVGVILDVDLEGLMSYTAPEGIDTLDEFAAELANILNTYAKGLVEWLLLGDDYTFFVKEDAQKKLGSMITINGANGYSEGLALLLEALGVAAPAVVYTEGKLDTEATLKAVFAAIAARINAIFAKPVEEVLALLPNVIYFLNSNGVATVVDNTIAAVTALLNKLTVFGVNLDINALVNLPKLMGIEDKGAKISLDNLTVGAIIEAVGFMLDLDLIRLDEVLNPFAIGDVVAYNSISSQTAYKMVVEAKEDKADMITVILGAALRVVFENEDNTAKIEDMLGTDILSAIKTVFEDVEITYTAPEWDYITTGNDYELAYPTNWTEDTAKYVAAMLPEIADLVAGIIDNNYTSIEALLKDKVNVFTADTLNSIVGLLKNIIPDMYKELLGVGVILDVNLNGLLDYECDKEFATVNEFAAELANILSTYIPGVIEWLLLGKDFTFFVEADAQGDLGTMITINGANGYSEGLALLLEALGCQNLPKVEGNTTKAIVAGVLDSVAELINSIFADPVTAVLGLLPNIFYFLNTNGVAAVVDNTIAAVTALLDKLAVFGVELDINELVNLPKLMGIEGKGAKISLDNLSMAAILEAVGLMTGLKLGKLEDLLVGYDLGKLVEYDSVSTSVGATFKMTYGDEYKVYDMITVIANAALIVFTHKDNAEVVKGLIGEDIYAVILNFLATAEIKMQDMSWIYTDKVGTVFSAMERSEEYAGFTYGQLYTETHAEYIADNFPVVVDNVIELLGLEAGKTLEEVLNNLIDGSIYKSDLVITVRDALAGVLDGITKLEVGGVVVGGYIAEVLKTAGIADLNAVAKVEVPEFTADKEQFVASLCDVLEPLYPILKYVLANKDITFFVADNGTDPLVTLTGAEGYVYGIIPLLEALGCEGILAPEAYYAGIDANADTLITSIINPLLNKVDKILAAPADEILALLPNLVYFINSNGIDTVVKNTLNAVYAVLAKIQPIAAIDLYELIGIDLATIDFEWILDKVLELLAGMGYEFDVEEIDYVSELTVGKLEKYTSLNGKEAYRMVYTPDDATSGDKAEMVTTIERLVITFITDEKNQAMVVDFLQDNLGMGEAGTKFIEGTIDVLADCAVNTSIGMELALMSTYYVFYGVDTGVQGTVDGMGKLDNAFNGLMDLIEDVNPDSYDLLNKIFGKIDPDGDVFNPGNDGEDDGEAEEGGIAQNGLIKFFQKISTWFQNIGTWFKNLFSFSFLKK